MSLTTCEPKNIRAEWKKVHARGIKYDAFGPISNLLAFLCRFSIGGWDPSWLDLVFQLPYPKRDKYASVRTGDVFLSFDEEASIIQHVDEVCQQVAYGLSYCRMTASTVIHLKQPRDSQFA